MIWILLKTKGSADLADAEVYSRLIPVQAAVGLDNMASLHID